MFKTFNKKICLVFLVCTMFFVPIVLASSSSDGHGNEGGTAPKGWVKEDTYRVINFVILFSVLGFVLRKPIANALNARIKGIREELEKLKVEKEETEQKLSEYESKIASFNKEKEDIIASYKKQGELAKSRILKEAENASIKLEEQAKKNIAYEFKLAKEELKAELADKSLIKAEALVKENITKDDQDKLLNEYLTKVA